MDANRFDALARQIAQPFRRRRLLGVAAALLATGGQRRPVAAKTCCGTTWDCGDCTCSCAADGSFSGCCCGTICYDANGTAGACITSDQLFCCGGAGCGLNQVCVEDGVCGGSCPPGTTQCGQRCCEACDASGNGCGLPPPPPPLPCAGTTCNGQCCAAGVGCDLTGLHCAVPCEGGLLACGGTCILPCAPGLVLNSDTCACECPGSTVPCGEQCANLKNDRRHCGRCGKRCRRGQRCRGGKCR